MELDSGTIAAMVAALTGAGLAVDRYFSRKAESNGHRPLSKIEGEGMVAGIREAVQGNAEAIKTHTDTVDRHIKENAAQHADLHDRVTVVQTDVAEIKGQLRSKSKA